MIFEDVSAGDTNTWWTRLVTQYDPRANQYAASFPSDKTTVYFKADDEDYRHFKPNTTLTIQNT